MKKTKSLAGISSERALARKREITQAKREAEILTLREWYESTLNHSDEIKNYFTLFSNLGRLGKELHLRGVSRVTERFGDDARTLVEATYTRRDLDIIAPLCALACTAKKLGNKP